MKPDFEIKYLDLKWYDKETLTKVTESMNSLRLEYNQRKQIFESETTIYPNLEGIEDGHLAVRFFNTVAEKPYIQLASDEKFYLTPIKDPNSGTTWWIAKSKWLSKKNRWRGIAPNLAGTVRLFLQTTTCDIAIHGSDFTRDQLNQYLRVFKNDLWELIIDESSVAQAEAKETQTFGVNNKVIDCIYKLASHSEKILETPKVELREIQGQRRRASVRPVNRTFMELATKTNQRFLTSRDTEPSYNVAENRYVLFALERCIRIIRQIIILANNKSRRYEDTIQKLQWQHDSFSNTVKVDRDLVVSDLEKIGKRAKKEYWQEKLDKDLIDNGIPLSPTPSQEHLYLRVENMTIEGDGFFVKVWNGNNWVNPDDKFGILSFRHTFSNLVNVIEPGMVLSINGRYGSNATLRAVVFQLIEIHAIYIIGCYHMEKAREAFKREKYEGLKLEKNNWTKKLNKKELQEQEKEKRALVNRIDFYKRSKDLSSEIHSELEPKLKKLQKIARSLKAKKIKPSSNFPNSMTFVQNPNYQGLHTGYKVLREITGLASEDFLLSLEEIDEIGLINMPLIYERWVLLQIILVLKDTFRFSPQDDWKDQIIEAIKTNRTDISINLSNESSKRFITLWYEKTLPNNRRPDFIVDLIWFAEKDTNNTEPRYKRFVIDAKFYNKYTFDKSGGMLSKVNELYFDKNYSEGSENPVFLIHPCSNLIEKPVTSQAWGKNSFLGEIDLFDDGVFYSHDKGAIFLSPIDRTFYSDELQRLLGMFLQYKLEQSDTENLPNDRTEASPICIRCGSSNIKDIEKRSTYYDKEKGKQVDRTHRSVWMQCVECEQRQFHNHCGNKSDKKNRIIKNGPYWSYHSARALEPFNMKCPSCGEWGAW